MKTKTFDCAVAESTCPKRVTVCELFDSRGNLLARESNRCDPPGGICARMSIREEKESYAVTAGCNWDHAEARAIRSCNGSPVTAIVYGHDFVCPECERRLRAAGVVNIKIVASRGGAGMR